MWSGRELSDVIKGKDVLIGVSAPGIVTADIVSTMAGDATVSAMANPVHFRLNFTDMALLENDCLYR